MEELASWIPSVTTSGLLGVAVYLGQRLVEARLGRTVQHEFDARLERIRAELRHNEELLRADLQRAEAEIAALQSGALAALAGRQAALDAKRLDAADHLWQAVLALRPTRSVAATMAAVNFPVAAEHSKGNVLAREVFSAIGSGVEDLPEVASTVDQCRPYVSPLAWALFEAYRSTGMRAVAKVHILKSGIGNAEILKVGDVEALVKAALPERTQHVDEFGDAGLHLLMDELEARILAEIGAMLQGDEHHKANVDQAALILSQVQRLRDEQASQSVPPAAPAGAE